jgi:glyoxylase-like metal-dependent hydrolase (beta-lactamase superfamily II)
VRNRRSLAAIVALFAFGAIPHARPTPADAGGANARTEAGFRLYLFDCGTMKERDGVPYGLSLEQLPPRDLSDPCAFVVHHRGTMLWETGLHESVNNTPPSSEPARPGRPRPGDRVERTLKSQLTEIGYSPSDITYLALSHSHWDHTGNVKDYLGSTWLVQKPERDAIFGPAAPPNRGDYAGLDASKTQILAGDHDVFGDGTVMLLFTPGHTAGHQALFVKLPQTGPVILSGDLYHFPEELTLKPAPSGRNADQIAASKAKVQALIEKTGAQLWIQHDVRGFAKLRKSPEYYY